MLYVCISFDYELFMGQNYASEEDVLLKPSAKLSQMLKEHGVSATFFADVCCPKAYRRLGKPAFADAFDAQLQDLTLSGHDVQLHIHPHWEKATEVGENVVFPRESYRIHNWITESGDFSAVQGIIHESVDYLNRLITPVKEDYRCLAFRAGGYCLQPEKELVNILHQEGIRIDSSVCQGFSYDDDGMYYDYRDYTQKSNIYLSAEYGLADHVEQRISDSVLEVPVAGYDTFLLRAIASKLNSLISAQKPNGCAMQLQQNAHGAKKMMGLKRLRRILSAANMLTFDFYNERAMIYMLKRIAKEEHCDTRDVFISAIAHPKGQTDEHIENMKHVIETLQKTGKVAFVSMRQIADKLQL